MKSVLFSLWSLWFVILSFEMCNQDNDIFSFRFSFLWKIWVSVGEQQVFSMSAVMSVHPLLVWNVKYVTLCASEVFSLEYTSLNKCLQLQMQKLSGAGCGLNRLLNLWFRETKHTFVDYYIKFNISLYTLTKIPHSAKKHNVLLLLSMITDKRHHFCVNSGEKARFRLAV